MTEEDEIVGGWRKLHIEDLHNLYFSPNIIRVIKSRRMRWAGHVVRIRKERSTYEFLAGKAEGKRPIHTIILKWISERYGGVVWTGLIWLSIMTNGGVL
jgi:hypothetical protein